MFELRLVTLKRTWYPKTFVSVSAIAALTADSPDGWSGYGGVLISGGQSAWAAVAGLPSRSASRMAVIGRQNSQRALSTQVLIRASAPVV